MILLVVVAALLVVVGAAAVELLATAPSVDELTSPGNGSGLTTPPGEFVSPVRVGRSGESGSKDEQLTPIDTLAVGKVASGSDLTT